VIEVLVAQLKIKQIRSIIDRPVRQKRTIEALGLGRPNWVKIHNDTPQIRGMINKVSHLVLVEEIEKSSDAPAEKKKKTIRKKPAVKKASPRKTAAGKKKTTKSK
jgi:large subunit ribosomal protein L30